VLLSGSSVSLTLSSCLKVAVPLVSVLDEIRVPAINWSGSGLARGAWGFQLKVGSLPDEAGYLVRLVEGRGLRENALVRDRGPIGDEYAAFLRGGLDSLDVCIVVDVQIEDGADAGRCMDLLHMQEPPCVVYLGLGPNGVALCRAMHACGWRVPVIGNIGIGVFPEAALEGVVFTDVVDDTNPVLRRFARRWHARFAVSLPLLGLAAAHDLATTALEALRHAPALTPAGVRTRLPSTVSTRSPGKRPADAAGMLGSTVPMVGASSVRWPA